MRNVGNVFKILPTNVFFNLSIQINVVIKSGIIHFSVNLCDMENKIKSYLIENIKSIINPI